MLWLLSCILCLNAYVPESSVVQEDSLLYIRAIHINRGNVFPASNRTTLARLTNRFHVVTKEAVIQRELLFEEGEVLDRELLEESERGLRRLDFLGEADIRTEAVDSDSVDVYVTTEDQWSTVLGYIIESGGGLTEVGGNLEEFNFLGAGKSLYAEAVHEVDLGTTWYFDYSDPQLFGSHWNGSIGFSTGPLLESFFFGFGLPFYSPDAPWSYGLAGFAFDETVRLFDQGRVSSLHKEESQGLLLDASRAFGKRYRKRRVEVAYRYENRQFAALGEQTTTPLPDDELIHATTLTVSRERISYVEDTRINKFVQTEDFQLGSTTSLSLGRTGFPFPRGVKRFEVAFSHHQAYQLARKHYLFLTGSFDTLFEKDTFLTLRSQYYFRYLAHQTLAVNVDLNLSRDMEEGTQFLLGGDSGLRGYPARAFGGDKRFLANIENRVFSSLTILTVAVGGVVFFDAGHVWKRDEAVNFNNLNYSAGLGLRLGYTKAPGAPVARFDIGWPLNREGGPEISLGVGQHF